MMMFNRYDCCSNLNDLQYTWIRLYIITYTFIILAKLTKNV